VGPTKADLPSGMARQNSAGHLLWLIRSGRARTRSELQQVTGLSRSTVGQRLDRLIGAGYLREPGVDSSTGGRPPTLLEFNDKQGVILAANFGATHARVAALDLAARPLAEERADLRIADGPRPVLDWLGKRFTSLLDQAGHDAGDVSGIGLGVPGPVVFTTGRVLQPAIMPGWDDYPIIEHLHRFFDVPVLVDNDAYLMALGEHVTHLPDCPTMVLVKVATGIGAGIIVNGAIHRGIDGAAGIIGHVRPGGHHEARCLCGSNGCLAAVASGAAIAERLTTMGVPTASSQELLARITAGHPDACRLAREAGQDLGKVLATVVCLINPGAVVIAGDLAETNFLTGVREVLYRLAPPRATRQLSVVTSGLGERAGVVGAHAMVIDSVYAPEAVNRRLEGIAT
jgi:predicted NBD/HSP70 family sugar kinase